MEPRGNREYVQPRPVGLAARSDDPVELDPKVRRRPRENVHLALGLADEHRAVDRESHVARATRDVVEPVHRLDPARGAHRDLRWREVLGEIRADGGGGEGARAANLQRDRDVDDATRSADTRECGLAVRCGGEVARGG